MILLSAVFFAGCHQSPPETLTIATAANMQFAMKEILNDFTQKTGIECNSVISSSGKLTAQIKAGAPYDVFVSADMKYPETLYKSGFAIEKPKIYAYGNLVLWSLKKRDALALESLIKTDVHHIALANPITAPYGVAAEEVLKSQHLYSKIKDKLVFGESIAQTNQFILSGTADMGFTAQSVLTSPEVKGKGSWIVVDPKLYQPIAQGILILKNSRKKEQEARKLMQFLFSTEGRAVLKKYGYSIPES